MKHRKLIYILFCFLILISLYGCKKNKEEISETVSLNQDHSNDPLLLSDVNIDTIVYEDKEGDVLYNEVKVDQIILPERYVEKYKILAEAIDVYNANSKKNGKDFLDDQKYEIRTMRSERNDNTLELSYEDIVTIYRIDDEIFSFFEEVSTYTGGAHGSYAPIGRNYIVNNGKELTSFEVFTDINKLKNVLFEKILSLYSEAELFSEWKETINTYFDEKKPLNILIGNEFVDVIFDPYSLAPWSTGAITITLPYDEYSDILNKKYFN